METKEKESFTIPAEQTLDANKTESAENFQKFIYELFDKNGILNDLRAYLRGHIVDVLKNAHTGEPPSCQKHFTQRLEPKYQAINMLVTEYLLCMEFGYSLSVFISEIPLANMVFGFAKSLMELGADNKTARLRFKEHDVWSILNYLGVKCDSNHANNIIEMYKTQKDAPLLMCILKCIPLHNPEVIYPSESQDGSVSSDSKSSDSESCRRPRGCREKCKHYAFCKTCHSRFQTLRDKYRKKKKHFCKNVKQPNVNPMNVQNLLKKIELMERNLIDEMFEQQKSVYETEIDIVKSATEDQIKRSLASHALHFQERQSELEETFKAREAALEGNIEHKKRFLWGLAKALRTQHAQMTSAMQAVKEESKRLADKEKSLKTQLTEAEECLKQRGEDMRKQIADELAMLEQHLESMKTERDTLNRERSELDTRLSHSDTKIVNVNVENKDLNSHFELLKEELGIMKKYLEGCRNVEPKCVAERSTITEVSNVHSRINVVMNNEAEVGYVREEVKPKQVVNDLKKQKNVNFSQPPPINAEESTAARSSSRNTGSRSPNVAGAALRSLADDNERLRRTAAQQSAQIAELSSLAARMQTEMRPRTAPASLPRARANSFGWCKGAGEELSFQLGLGQQPTVLAPGALQPFIGACAERRSDSRRHLINQWRAMRRHISPLASGSNSRPERNRSDSNERPGVSISSPPSTHREMENRPREEVVVFQAVRDTLRNKRSVEGHTIREKSPKSVLREAKERLRTVTRPSSTRDKSPCAALREAKLRLRKLEIEAAAVERSYMDFRRRRQRRGALDADDSNLTRTDSFHAEDMPENSQVDTLEKKNNSMKIDLEKFLSKYQNELDIGQTHFRNKNTAAEIRKPIPEVFSEVNRDMQTKLDYLAKPLPEFRKLYYTQPDRKPDNVEKTPKLNLEKETPDNSKYSEEFKERLSENEKAKHNREKELEMLEQNLSKIYNLQDEPTKETDDKPLTNKIEEVNLNGDNLLRVEIENTDNENDVLVIESSVDSRAVSKAESYKERLSTQMTILVSPKKVDDNANSPEKTHRSPSPEQEANLTRKDVFNAIFDAAKDSSSNELKLEPNYQESGNEQEYVDDFSADVDNYNSKSGSEHDISTPVSLPKTSEDDFWD